MPCADPNKSNSTYVLQVSVRKAALVALSTLLELFPAERSLCTAWVTSALPLVRDVEASIQVGPTLHCCGRRVNI